jgi:hypothetical protein
MNLWQLPKGFRGGHSPLFGGIGAALDGLGLEERVNNWRSGLLLRFVQSLMATNRAHLLGIAMPTQVAL